MSPDAFMVTELLQRLERRVGDLQTASRSLVGATQVKSQALIHESMTDSYHVLVGMSSIIVPLRRAIMSYDGLGRVLSITELALRATRLVALALLPFASPLIRDSFTDLDERARIERRLFTLQQETHRIGLLWVPYRARLRSGSPRLGGNWDSYVVSTRSAWRCWTRLAADAELSQALRSGLSRGKSAGLRSACAALLTILNVQRFGESEASAVQALSATTLSSWLNDAAAACE